MNTGIMAVNVAIEDYIWCDEHEMPSEFYLTDIIAWQGKDGRTVASVIAETIEVAGVNDKVQFGRIRKNFSEKSSKSIDATRLNAKDPTRFDCRGSLNFGQTVKSMLMC
ncbi:MAG: hypothetical protein H0A76_13275 [Candidatus Thiodubiliella endoseptemdiera]|uniref:Uncharacterized protein n=1 Tax=Candidatus Thiodubiliella endoseptemdiera TaxID=2738886 RepID=A0A853FAU6_9GAMM|nr:hypothetical protein [Candidatus Thiodubiliella endoseptemdiera]